MISTIGRSPIMAEPSPAPTIAASLIGVSKTRSGPCFSSRPPVTAKTPPAAATSSPKKITRSSAASASSSPSRTAVRKSITGSHEQRERLLEQPLQMSEERRRFTP